MFDSTPNFLSGIFSARNRNEFESGLQSNSYRVVQDFGAKIVSEWDGKPFGFDGICLPCNKKVSFLVDLEWGGQVTD